MLPNFQEEFCVETDVSGQGVNAVLQHKRRLIAYFSKPLGVRHQALSIYDKEIMVVIMAVKKWHLYLVGRHFQIKTDQQSLTFLTDKQAITPYQRKWMAKMIRYYFSIAYKKGTPSYLYRWRGMVLVMKI